MRRRDFIAGLGSAAAWPVVARAQQSGLPVIGFISGGSLENSVRYLTAFRAGLSENGYVESQNVTVEYHWLEGQFDRVPGLVADLVRRRVAVIATPGNPVTALAAKAATATIPIVFGVGDDPVRTGLVASLSRPGGNLTGVNSFIAELWTKHLDLVTQLLPNTHVFGMLATGGTPNQLDQLRTEAQPTADAIGRKLLVVTAFTAREIDEAFAALLRQGAEALIIRPSPLTYDRREQLAALAARYSIPAIYPFRENAEAGGLMSYGINIDESMRLVGVYVGRVLKGEKPGDLPVVQPTKFELMINLKTAKTLGLEVPSKLLALADEVIE
jgi:putative tryptophan/tyrosine transport system substrate-binding protein